MTIRLKVYNGTISLPTEIHLPDGTEVEISVIGATNEPAELGFRFPTFCGNGLMPGVDLEDKEAIEAILEGDKYPRQP